MTSFAAAASPSRYGDQQLTIAEEKKEEGRNRRARSAASRADQADSQKRVQALLERGRRNRERGAAIEGAAVKNTAAWSQRRINRARQHESALAEEERRRAETHRVAIEQERERLQRENEAAVHRRVRATGREVLIENVAAIAVREHHAIGNIRAAGTQEVSNVQAASAAEVAHQHAATAAGVARVQAAGQARRRH